MAQTLLICGPNGYGVFNVRLGAATFSADFIDPLRPGSVALVSRSGGFSHAIAEHLVPQRGIGLSYIVSCGNQAGVGRWIRSTAAAAGWALLAAGVLPADAVHPPERELKW